MGREKHERAWPAGGGKKRAEPTVSGWDSPLSSSFVMLCNLCAYNRPLPIEWFFLGFLIYIS